jgi:hypothetical protein
MRPSIFGSTATRSATNAAELQGLIGITELTENHDQVVARLAALRSRVAKE